ncbi:MAG: nicotinate-nucleotide--dimethylbenzimidazole phosphoribosyltransferase [Promethearchaeota archaeon]
MKKFDIKPTLEEIVPSIQAKIDSKNKPLGSLGMMEEIALKLGTIQNNLTPILNGI